MGTHWLQLDTIPARTETPQFPAMHRIAIRSSLVSGSGLTCISPLCMNAQELRFWADRLKEELDVLVASVEVVE